MSVRRGSSIYKVPKTGINERMNGRASHSERQPNCSKLDYTEEEVLCRHILDLDARGFPPDLAGVEDMANLILASRGGKRVGKL